MIGWLACPHCGLPFAAAPIPVAVKKSGGIGCVGIIGLALAAAFVMSLLDGPATSDGPNARQAMSRQVPPAQAAASAPASAVTPIVQLSLLSGAPKPYLTRTLGDPTCVPITYSGSNAPPTGRTFEDCRWSSARAVFLEDGSLYSLTLHSPHHVPDLQTLELFGVPSRRPNSTAGDRVDWWYVDGWYNIGRDAGGDAILLRSQDPAPVDD